ncbi:MULTISPECIES: lycopene cyclase domain-containing protein [Flexivirga]|uniref:Lycopene cyclase n=1 Tax=Flexivirga endophytica TaxID=1849103 RepID=A0A916SZ76_9MICO|nr:lycopene cyclase domain-containing protein [Flexivirga endophytica]GGB24330.1 lycopene cyclase [Flexivirga endophytica]GHB63025.1 lycopene cyclase [Flexivirga endophytica]
MSLRHLSYVAMLAFCLAGTLPLEFGYRLGVLHRPLRLLTTIVLASAPFVAWDVWATHAGQWHFDSRQALPWRVGGLPLEEIAFFVVVPLAAILTYEAVRHLTGSRHTRGNGPRRKGSV